MEEFENEYDRGIYWIILLVVVVILAVVGYFFVFNYHKKAKENVEEAVLEDDSDINSYKGVWTLYGDESKAFEEVCINIIDGSTVTFDFFIDGVAYFESQTAHLENNTATFEEIVDSKNGTIISGKMIFRNDKMFLAITTSSDEDDISPGTIEFTEKSDESVLN